MRRAGPVQRPKLNTIRILISHIFQGYNEIFSSTIPIIRPLTPTLLDAFQKLLFLDYVAWQKDRK